MEEGGPAAAPASGRVRRPTDEIVERVLVNFLSIVRVPEVFIVLGEMFTHTTLLLQGTACIFRTRRCGGAALAPPSVCCSGAGPLAHSIGVASRAQPGLHLAFVYLSLSSKWPVAFQ